MQRWNRPAANAVIIYEEAELRQKVANDDYWNQKRIKDAVHRLIVYGIGALAILGVAAIGFMIWYYGFGPQRDLKALLGLAVNVIAYIVGVITPAVQRVLTRDERAED